jgi:mannose-6-phosphate isomerase-like protein (cupin superfamily)
MTALIPSTKGQVYDYFGSRYAVLVDSTDTDGKYGLMQISVRAGREPPPHTHHREDEAYHILSGRWSFRAGAKTFEAGPGEFVLLPRLVEHVFKVDSDGATALMLLTPGGLEGAFRVLGEPFDGDGLPPLRQPDVPAIMKEMKARGMTFPPRRP